MTWMAQQHYGDVHVLPVGDTRCHTWPICWCRPVSQNLATKDGPAQAIMFSHNAIDRREK